MRLFLASAVLLQLADLASVDPAREVNQVALSPLGVVAKLLLIVALVAGVAAVGKRWLPVLVFAAGAGLVGFVSNVR